MRFRFSDEQVEELRLICERDYQRSVTQLEARQMSGALFDLYEWLIDLVQSGRIDHLTRPEDVDGAGAGNA